MEKNRENAGSRDRRYFIVKHGLADFEAHPEWIWRTSARYGMRNEPKGYKQVRRGDQWVSFAYTTSDEREQPLNLVTGFYECTQEKDYFTAPDGGLRTSEAKHAWVIKGKPCGKQPSWHVAVPPVRQLLGRNVFNQQAITPIKEKEFNNIRRAVLKREFDPRKIPLLRRPPRCEQEVLSIVVAGHKQLGIREIVCIRKAFPDLLVKLKGRKEPVHLELEAYSQGFLLHGHQRQIRNCCFKEDGQRPVPVAVLCWVDNDKSDKRVRKNVHRVYELQSLFRDKKKIQW